MGLAMANPQQQTAATSTTATTGQPSHTTTNNTCSPLSSPSRKQGGDGEAKDAKSLLEKGGKGHQGASARKLTAQQSIEACVADSLDDQMIDRMCATPGGLDRNEWIATQSAFYPSILPTGHIQMITTLPLQPSACSTT